MDSKEEGIEKFEDQHYWQGLEFLLAIQKIHEFEKNNHGIAVKVLYTSKKGIYTACRLKCNGNCSKQANLLMIADGEYRHNKAIKNILRLLKSLNATHTVAYHFCMNYLNGFCTASAKNKHYKNCSSNGDIKVKMPSEKKSLRFGLRAVSV